MAPKGSPLESSVHHYVLSVIIVDALFIWKYVAGSAPAAPKDSPPEESPPEEAPKEAAPVEIKAVEAKEEEKKKEEEAALFTIVEVPAPEPEAKVNTKLSICARARGATWGSRMSVHAQSPVQCGRTCMCLHVAIWNTLELVVEVPASEPEPKVNSNLTACAPKPLESHVCMPKFEVLYVDVYVNT